MTSLEFASLRKNFGSTTALVDVNFRCEPGEITVLTGASGAGKTTALRIAAGLTHPSEGQVLFSGNSLSGFRHPANVAGFCLDPAATHPGRNVRATLTHAALLAGGSKRDVKPMAEFIGLKRLLNTAAGDLPAHQQYRLALGVALMGNPDVLVIDEPFDHLTDADRPWLIGLLRSLANTSKTVLVSCGLDVDTTDFADRIITMRLGRISKDLRCDESAPSGALQTTAPPEVEFVEVEEPATRAGRRAGMVPGGQPVASVTRGRGTQVHTMAPAAQPAARQLQTAPRQAQEPALYPAASDAALSSATFPQLEPLDVTHEPDTLDDVFRRYVGSEPQHQEPEHHETPLDDADRLDAALTAVVPTVSTPSSSDSLPTSELAVVAAPDATPKGLRQPAELSPVTSVLASADWAPSGRWGEAASSSALEDWHAAYRPSASSVLPSTVDQGWDEPGSTFAPPWSEHSEDHAPYSADRGWGLSATIGTPASTAASFATDVSLGNAVPSGDWTDMVRTPTYSAADAASETVDAGRPLSMYEQVASTTFAASTSDAPEFAADLVGSRSGAEAGMVGAQRVASYASYSGVDAWPGSSEMSTSPEVWLDAYLDAPSSGYQGSSTFDPWTPNETRTRSHG